MYLGKHKSLFRIAKRMHTIDSGERERGPELYLSLLNGLYTMEPNLTPIISISLFCC